LGGFTTPSSGSPIKYLSIEKKKKGSSKKYSSIEEEVA
jgi:hypothetical protein